MFKWFCCMNRIEFLIRVYLRKSAANLDRFLLYRRLAF
jgi:hypothetical protein